MTPKRTILQDRTIAQINSDVKKKCIYLELHFVTTEFEYDTGRIFVAQLLDHLERISPHGLSKVLTPRKGKPAPYILDEDGE